jgi:hypothetical protein
VTEHGDAVVFGAGNVSVVAVGTGAFKFVITPKPLMPHSVV